MRDYWGKLVKNDITPNDWGCIVCSYPVLQWGFIHGECRCVQCHTPYQFEPGTIPTVTLDGDDGLYGISLEPALEPVSEPVSPKCMVKQEFLKAVKRIWEETAIYVEDMDIDTLEEYARVSLDE